MYVYIYIYLGGGSVVGPPPEERSQHPLSQVEPRVLVGAGEQAEVRGVCLCVEGGARLERDLRGEQGSYIVYTYIYI